MAKEYERSFKELKGRLMTAFVLTFPSEMEGYIVYNHASRK